MKNNKEPFGASHVYRPKLWITLLNIFSLIFIWIFLSIPLFLLILFFTSLLQTENQNAVVLVGLSCLLFPFILLIMSAILIHTLNVIFYFFSYIKITPDGIEQKYFPYRHIRCSWAEVDKIDKYLYYDALFLRSFEIISPSISLRRPFNPLHLPRNYILLSTVNGWPDGQLAADIVHYVPNIFERKNDPQPPQQETERQFGISNENRLLAALSHASVIFSVSGILAPIAIYAIQRKKSDFVEFQSLQALVWQFLCWLVTLISSFLMTVFFIFIAVVINIVQTGPSVDVSIIPFIIGLAIPFIFMLINLFFVVYGVIGALIAYQGRNFHYPIIGKMLEKRNNSRKNLGLII